MFECYCDQPTVNMTNSKSTETENINCEVAQVREDSYMSVDIQYKTCIINNKQDQFQSKFGLHDASNITMESILNDGYKVSDYPMDIRKTNMKQESENNVGSQRVTISAESISNDYESSYSHGNEKHCEPTHRDTQKDTPCPTSDPLTLIPASRSASSSINEPLNRESNQNQNSHHKETASFSSSSQTTNDLWIKTHEHLNHESVALHGALDMNLGRHHEEDDISCLLAATLQPETIGPIIIENQSGEDEQRPKCYKNTFNTAHKLTYFDAAIRDNTAEDNGVTTLPDFTRHLNMFSDFDQNDAYKQTCDRTPQLNKNQSNRTKVMTLELSENQLKRATDKDITRSNIESASYMSHPSCVGCQRRRIYGDISGPATSTNLCLQCKDTETKNSGINGLTSPLRVGRSVDTMESHNQTGVQTAGDIYAGLHTDLDGYIWIENNTGTSEGINEKCLNKGEAFIYGNVPFISKAHVSTPDNANTAYSCFTSETLDQEVVISDRDRANIDDYPCRKEQQQHVTQSKEMIIDYTIKSSPIYEEPHSDMQIDTLQGKVENSLEKSSRINNKVAQQHATSVFMHRPGGEHANGGKTNDASPLCPSRHASLQGHSSWETTRAPATKTTCDIQTSNNTMSPTSVSHCGLGAPPDCLQPLTVASNTKYSGSELLEEEKLNLDCSQYIDRSVSPPKSSFYQQPLLSYPLYTGQELSAEEKPQCHVMSPPTSSSMGIDQTDSRVSQKQNMDLYCLSNHISETHTHATRAATSLGCIVAGTTESVCDTTIGSSGTNNNDLRVLEGPSIDASLCLLQHENRDASFEGHILSSDTQANIHKSTSALLSDNKAENLCIESSNESNDCIRCNVSSSIPLTSHKHVVPPEKQAIACDTNNTSAKAIHSANVTVIASNAGDESPTGALKQWIPSSPGHNENIVANGSNLSERRGDPLICRDVSCDVSSFKSCCDEGVSHCSGSVEFREQDFHLLESDKPRNDYLKSHDHSFESRDNNLESRDYSIGSRDFNVKSRDHSLTSRDNVYKYDDKSFQTCANTNLSPVRKSPPDNSDSTLAIYQPDIESDKTNEQSQRENDHKECNSTICASHVNAANAHLNESSEDANSVRNIAPPVAEMFNENSLELDVHRVINTHFDLKSLDPMLIHENDLKGDVDGEITENDRDFPGNPVEYCTSCDKNETPSLQQNTISASQMLRNENPLNFDIQCKHRTDCSTDHTAYCHTSRDRNEASSLPKNTEPISTGKEKADGTSHAQVQTKPVDIAKTPEEYTREKLRCRSLDDLRVLKHSFRFQIQVVSAELVRLLEARHVIRDAVDMRRVAINQLILSSPHSNVLIDSNELSERFMVERGDIHECPLTRKGVQDGIGYGRVHYGIALSPMHDGKLDSKMNDGNSHSKAYDDNADSSMNDLVRNIYPCVESESMDTFNEMDPPKALYKSQRCSSEEPKGIGRTFKPYRNSFHSVPSLQSIVAPSTLNMLTNSKRKINRSFSAAHKIEKFVSDYMISYADKDNESLRNQKAKKRLSLRDFPSFIEDESFLNL